MACRPFHSKHSESRYLFDMASFLSSEAKTIFWQTGIKIGSNIVMLQNGLLNTSQEYYLLAAGISHLLLTVWILFKDV